MKNIFSHLLELFFPMLCPCCKNKLIQGEKYICFSCLYTLPYTSHLIEKNNKLEDFFAGRFPFIRIASLLYFMKGGVSQKIIHEFKYHNNPELAYFIGKLCGKNISKHPYSDTIDLIVPIPLHKKRLKERGYNQSLMLAKGMAEIIRKPIDTDNLIRKINNPSQTKSSRFERWKNTERIFEIKNSLIYEDKHILLVDDVITTGSTLEVCANLILKSRNSKISIYSVGSAV